MNKNVSKITSLLLVVILLCSVFSVPSSAAFSVTDEQWNAYWDTKDVASVHLSPGSNDTEMCFAWFGTDSEVVPVVYVKSASDVDYTAFTGYTEANSSIDGVVYKVTATNLVPGIVYEYYCESGAYKSEIGSFGTSEGKSFNAVLVSDIHVSYDDENPDNIRNTAGLFNNILLEATSRQDDISLILSAGDTADRGRYDEYIGLFANPVVKEIPFATVCGNHDYKEAVFPVVMNRPNVYNDQAVSPDKNGGDYWFVKGDVLFLMLNSNWISSSDHKNFVKSAVEANPDVKWRVAVMHHDLYGGHIPVRESENELLRMMFAPIFDEYKVDLVFMGHSHVYSRSHVLYDNQVVNNLKGKNSVTDAQGTIYITTGSTSRPRDVEGNLASDKIACDYKSTTDYIYDVVNFSEDSITITVYAAENEEPIDNFTINKTSSNGGHIDEPINPFYDIVHFISLIASIFRSLGQMLGID